MRPSAQNQGSLAQKSKQSQHLFLLRSLLDRRQLEGSPAPPPPPSLFTSNSALMSMLASSHLSTLSCAHLPLPSKPDLPLSCPSCPHLHPHTLLYSPLSHLLTAFHVPSHAVTLSSMRSPPQLSALYIPLFVIDDSSNVFLLPFLLSFAHLGVLVLTSSLLPPCRLIPPSHSLHRAEATHLHSSTYHFCFSILFFSNLTPPLAF